MGKGPAYPVIVERDVEARMRDGVVLRADIARPRARGRFPALLTRTPYGKAVSTRLAGAGYVVIAQDMRGRYASDGDYTPMFAPGYRDAEDDYGETAFRVARQTVFHDARRPSRVVLPVMP